MYACMCANRVCVYVNACRCETVCMHAACNHVHMYVRRYIRMHVQSHANCCECICDCVVCLFCSMRGESVLHLPTYIRMCASFAITAYICPMKALCWSEVDVQNSAGKH